MALLVSEKWNKTTSYPFHIPAWSLELFAEVLIKVCSYIFSIFKKKERKKKKLLLKCLVPTMSNVQTSDWHSLMHFFHTGYTGVPVFFIQLHQHSI